MRSHDKKIHMTKVNILFEERNLFESDMLLEYEIFPYKDRNGKYANQNADRLNYSFDANGLIYKVAIWHDARSHNFGEYEVEFGISEQQHAGDRVGRDIKHLNSVLYTVFTIVEDVVKKFKIKNIKLEGARDEKDSSDAFYKGSIRSKLYLRFINSKYPSDAVKQVGPWIYIDMTRVYPDIVGNNDNLDELAKILVKISDEDPDIERIKRGFDGLSEDNFTFGGELYNSTMGGMEMTIDKDYGEYEVIWNLYEDDEETTSNGGLKTIEDVIYFLRQAFGV
jgi:hypothetical protein